MFFRIFTFFTFIVGISAIFLSDASLNEVKATLLKSIGSFGNPAPISPGGPAPVVPLAPVGVPRGGCPLCDSSVYSYCSAKVIHDACCCNAGNVPFACPPDDCSYLNANSCYEHALLFNCCCNNPYH